MRMAAERQLGPAVRQDVRDPEARGLPARQRVWLDPRHEPDELLLDDDEEADLRIVAPCLAPDPLVRLPGDLRVWPTSHLGHAHRPREPPAAVQVQADGVALADAHLRR